MEELGRTKHGEVFQDDELELDVVVGVHLDRRSVSNAQTIQEMTHPVLGRLSHERALSSTGTRVAQDGVSARAHEVVETRELHDERIVVLLVERSLVEILTHELAAQLEPSLFLHPVSSLENSGSATNVVFLELVSMRHRREREDVP